MKLIAKISLGGIILGLFTFFSACNQNNKALETGMQGKEVVRKDEPHSGQIAYVNLDSLEAKYLFFKKKKAEFEKRQKAMEDEITRLAQGLQNEYNKFQSKAQNGTMSQSEGEVAQKKLAAMQNNVENRRQSLGTQLMKDQKEFQDELQNRLDDFIAKYNKNQGYAYVLTYVKGGNILFADSSFDITNDIIEGMNKEDEANAKKAKDLESSKK